MSNFTREIRDFDQFETQWRGNAFLRRVDADLIQRGLALLTFRKNGVTLYFEGRQLCKLSRNPGDSKVAPYSPAIYNYYLPILRSLTLTTPKSKKPCYESEYIDSNHGGHTFSSVLPEILDNMDKERDAEAYQVSGFYRFSPMVAANDSNIILLDIEAAFSQKGKKTDRIDVVLYNKDSQQLIFVEVKRLSDKRLYKDVNTGMQAEILSQMKDYEDRINVEHKDINNQYNRVIEYYERLSGKKIPRIGNKKPLLGLLVVECTDIECNKRNMASIEFQTFCEDIQGAGYKMFTYGSAHNLKAGTLEKIYKAFK